MAVRKSVDGDRVTANRHGDWHNHVGLATSLAREMDRLSHAGGTAAHRRDLALLGGGGQQVSLPEHLASYGHPASTWMHWHYRAVERAAGLSPVCFDAAYLELCQNLWCKNLVQKQKSYHSDNERRFHKLDHRLHFLGTILFLATFVVCAIHLFSHHERDSFSFGLLALFAATLPAFGAAFAAIRSQGEFQRVSRRSGAMHERLTELSLDMSTVSTGGGHLNSCICDTTPNK